ncbi:MAG: S1C family serine protease, partial [Solirubrobacteraceae bacterium]
ILTCYHVVRGFSQIQVRLADHRKFPAEVVGGDPKTDVAVLKMTGAVPGDLATVQLGNSAAMQDGDLVLAVGAPYGLNETVTNGIISAKGRANISAYEDFLQINAAINPGSSGGPLVNMQGQVIGMNSAILSAAAAGGGPGQFAGVGFAIPINTIKALLPTLLRGGQISRGMIGVVMREAGYLAKQFERLSANGARISQVVPDSPAARAGLRSGDDVVGFRGQRIKTARDLRSLVSATPPGTRVQVAIMRNGRRKNYTLTVGKLKAPKPADPLVSIVRGGASNSF